MTYATYCSACDVGDCDNHHPGHTQDGLIGGWRCVCDHDPERRKRRQERFLRSPFNPLSTTNREDDR